MARNATGLASRFEGRLFSDGGRLHLVLDVDAESGMARVSCRGEVIEMPIAEVGMRLSTSSNLNLDTLNGAETNKRIVHKPDGWFFTTREGAKGPYPSKEDASQALGEHILSAQAKGKARPGAQRPALVSSA